MPKISTIKNIKVNTCIKGLRLIVEPSMTEIENIDLLKNILNAETDEVKKFKFIE